MKKKLLCLLLSALMIVSLFPLTVSAEDATDSWLPRVAIKVLKEKFPAGKYWNHDPSEPNNPDGYTDTPCDHHGYCGYTYNGSCGCNSFNRAIQCMGFSRKLAYDTFGTYASSWKQVYKDDFDGKLKAGDIARITMASSSGHSIFITAVEGNTITYADANYDQGCGIRWGATISRSDLMSRLIYVRIAPELAVPAAPQISLIDTCYQNDTVTATWDFQTMVDGYELLLTCDGATVYTGETMDTSFTFQIEKAGQYYLSVKAKNAAGAAETVVGSYAYTHHCPCLNFTDIPNYDHWAHVGIDYAVGNGLFNGVSATEFEPGEPMTRAMIATVLWRSEGSPAVSVVNPFTDVAKTEWYATAIFWAYSTGLMKGMGDGTFEPEGSLTREQIATVLYRYGEYKALPLGGSASLDAFADATLVDAWAADAVKWAVANGVIKGSQEENGLFVDPLSGATREQVATILMRFIEDVMKAKTE